MKLSLPESVSSKQDLEALRLEIRDYAKWYAHNAIKKRVGAHHPTDPPELSPACLDMIHVWTRQNPLTEISLDKLETELQKLAASAPSVTITLAAPAIGELRKKLVAWCRANIAADVLVNFQFNSTLLGGMVVRSGSHIFDWSLRREIMASRSKFPEVLRHV